MERGREGRREASSGQVQYLTDPTTRTLATQICEANTCLEKQQDTCFQGPGHLPKDGTRDLKMTEPQKPTLV